jgi:hypothetical protein
MEITVSSRNYILSEEYVSKDGKVETATVKLIVDESQKKFEVKPGDNMDAFYFTSRMPADFGMWAAVAKLAYMAVEFGIKELKLEIKSPKDLEEVPFPETTSDDK